jgi:uncharacterized Zn finger protein (UPF0148 family)
MHTTPGQRCPECMVYRDTLVWIDSQLRAAVIKRTILARIALVLKHDPSVRPPTWVWFPLHPSTWSPCRSSSWFHATEPPSVVLSRCDCMHARDVTWRRFIEIVDLALDAAYRPTRCERCGFEVERCICTEVQPSARRCSVTSTRSRRCAAGSREGGMSANHAVGTCGKCGGPKYRDRSGHIRCGACDNARRRRWRKERGAGTRPIGRRPLPDGTPCRNCGSPRRRDASGKLACFHCNSRRVVAARRKAMESTCRKHGESKRRVPSGFQYCRACLAEDQKLWRARHPRSDRRIKWRAKLRRMGIPEELLEQVLAARLAVSDAVIALRTIGGQ